MGSDFDLIFMRHALQLANKGEFTAHPNPLVGCVIVQEHHIVGEGLHWQRGTSHAECHAIAQAGEKAKGATCYVTLEPCDHQGYTGPCVKELINAKIQKVVIATIDPNPQVAGQGIAALKAAGIQVEVGLLSEEAKALNKGFFSRMIRKRPYVRAKMAISLDGKIAMASGESQWITTDAARLNGQMWRARSGAVLTGSQTVRHDNCRLTLRNLALLPDLPENIHYQQPLRVVLDTQLTCDPSALIFQGSERTLLMTSEQVSLQRQQAWLAQVSPSVTLQCLPEQDGRIDLLAVLKELGQQEINDLLIEGGPTLVGALIKQNLIDELLIYLAPKLLGSQAKSMLDLPLEKLNQHIAGVFSQVERIGPDLHFTLQLTNEI